MYGQSRSSAEQKPGVRLETLLRWRAICGSRSLLDFLLLRLGLLCCEVEVNLTLLGTYQRMGSEQ
jgi:hypothetical protein